jgi:hypothetical protein
VCGDLAGAINLAITGWTTKSGVRLDLWGVVAGYYSRFLAFSLGCTRFSSESVLSRIAKSFSRLLVFNEMLRPGYDLRRARVAFENALSELMSRCLLRSIDFF